MNAVTEGEKFMPTDNGGPDCTPARPSDETPIPGIPVNSEPTRAPEEHRAIVRFLGECRRRRQEAASRMSPIRPGRSGLYARDPIVRADR